MAVVSGVVVIALAADFRLLARSATFAFLFTVLWRVAGPNFW